MPLTKQGWRIAADPHRARLGLMLAVLAGALLRFWALGQGIGFNPGVDEPEIMERAVRMMKTGDLNPHFYDYPGLYIHLQGAVAVARFLAGAMQGKWAALTQAPTEDFYLWGRGLTALLGTATIAVVYRIGARWSPRTALVAAALIAVMPMHVRESHYVLTDVPVTFAVMLTLLLSLRAHERATVRAFVWAGIAAGLAGAVKYNGGIAVVVPLAAAAMTPAVRPTRVAAMAMTLAATLAAFLAAAPYTLIDLPTFLNSFARLSSEYRGTTAGGAVVWQTYLKHIRIALGAPGTVLVCGGLVLAAVRVVRGPDRLKWVLTLGFPLLYFKFISGQSIVFGRYLMPLIPALSVLAAAFVVWLVDRVHLVGLPRPARNAVTVALALLAIAPPAYTAVRWDSDAARTWTQALAYDWVRHNIRPGARIRLEGSVTFHLPASYHTTRVMQLRLDGASRNPDPDVDYLIASSQCYGEYLGNPERFPTEYADYRQIFDRNEEVARFTPSAAHPGPEFRILKVKHGDPPG